MNFRFFWISRIALFLCLVTLVGGALHAQDKYGLRVQLLSAYKENVQEHPENELIDLSKYIPGIVLDIRYATANNFTNQKVYDLARAYARRPVADALLRASEEFSKRGLAIKMFDAYRPYKATVRFYEIYHDTTYVASPYRGSRHNRGCALDMTLVDARTGKEVKMPTGYDSFSKDAWPTTPAKDKVSGENRAILIDIMQRHGFTVYESEWWHFDFVGWQKYEILDIDFEQLE